MSRSSFSFSIASSIGILSSLGLLCIWPNFAKTDVFDANAAFLDNEKPNGTEVNPYTDTSAGVWSYGYSLIPGSITLFTGGQHSDSFNGNSGLEGWFVSNSALVPAILQNTGGSPLATNFGATLGAGQLLLHP